MSMRPGGSRLRAQQPYWRATHRWRKAKTESEFAFPTPLLSVPEFAVGIVGNGLSKSEKTPRLATAGADGEMPGQWAELGIQVVEVTCAGLTA
jgi:hypothetical protein